MKNITEEIKKVEYWKITELKEYLLMLGKEDKLRCEVTRSEENDVTTKIKLMQEAEEFGRQEAQKLFKDAVEELKADDLAFAYKDYTKLIEKRSTMEICNDSENCNSFVIKRIKQKLLKVLEEK